MEIMYNFIKWFKPRSFKPRVIHITDVENEKWCILEKEYDHENTSEDEDEIT